MMPLFCYASVCYFDNVFCAFTNDRLTKLKLYYCVILAYIINCGLSYLY